MEKIRVSKKKSHLLLLTSLTVLFSACSSGFLKLKDREIFKNEEFDRKVVIKTVEAPVEPKKEPKIEETTTTAVKADSDKIQAVAQVVKVDSKSKAVKAVKGPTKKSDSKKGAVAAPISATPVAGKRLPELEDSEGFDGQRRPAKDPFRVGEKITHTVSYFGTPAGELTLTVKPYVEVNGRKSYNFETEIKSSRLFSQFYSVEDAVETFVDFENMVPHVFKLHIKESGQLKEAQSFFDHEKHKADYWENKYTKKHGHEEKKLSWEIAPFSQNAFSAIFYMRVFKWDTGKEYAFQVSDDEKNVIFKGKSLSREKIKTEAGEFNAIKLKAEIAARGALSQTGDLYFWISDDDRKFILRIEAKIKIGTLVSEVTEIEGR